MPSLIPSPLSKPQQLNMDGVVKMSLRERGNLRSWFLSILSQATSTEGLCFEEMSQWSQSLERLLSSQYGIKVFQAFLKSEFSDENIEFWMVCEDFKKIKCPFMLSSRAKKIFKRFIEAEAVREINIDHKTRDRIRRNMKELKPVCFDDAQRIVYGLMENDSYPRFLKSDLYLSLLGSTTESTNT